MTPSGQEAARGQGPRGFDPEEGWERHYLDGGCTTGHCDQLTGLSNGELWSSRYLRIATRSLFERSVTQRAQDARGLLGLFSCSGSRSQGQSQGHTLESWS